MPHVEIPQAEFKVVLLGSSHIGKSSLVTRFSEGYYRENSRQPTVGAAFITKRIQSSENVTCKVQIWDTAGQPSFRAMAHMFYKDAAAVIVCYDVGSRRSFDEMREWLDDLRLKTNGSDEIVVMIAGLKADLMMQPQSEMRQDVSTFVPEQEVEQLAETLGYIYLPTSAKTGQNVRELFQRVADQVLQKRRDARDARKNDESQDVGEAAVNGENGHQTQQLESSNSFSNDNPVKVGKPSPRRSKYDKYNKQDTDSFQTPPRTPKKESKSSRKKKSRGSATPRSKSRRENHILEEETQLKEEKKGCGVCVCQPSGCGAGEGMDGGSGCIIS